MHGNDHGREGERGFFFAENAAKQKIAYKS